MMTPAQWKFQISRPSGGSVAGFGCLPASSRRSLSASRFSVLVSSPFFSTSSLNCTSASPICGSAYSFTPNIWPKACLSTLLSTIFR